MATLFMFYPENDAALANGRPDFTPPKNAALLRRSAAWLMHWVANDGDYVMADDGGDWGTMMRERYGLKSLCFNREYLADITAAVPWGWSAASRALLRRAGVDESLLPDDATVEALRRLSHRRASIFINRALADVGVDVPPLPVEVTDVDGLARLLSAGKPLMVKSPWSSSGRGVIDSESMGRERLLAMVPGIIRRQGSVVVEPRLHKVRDFAMLFEICDGAASYAGLSLFDNQRGTAYAGNVVATESALRRMLGADIDLSAVDALKAPLTRALNGYLASAPLSSLSEADVKPLTSSADGDAVASDSGVDGDALASASVADGVRRFLPRYCGVDMMVYEDADGRRRIAPCVELNLRMTMGVVAMKLSRRLGPDFRGSMTCCVGVAPAVAVAASPASLLAASSAPASAAASLALVPPNTHFNFLLTSDTPTYRHPDLSINR